MIFIASSGVYSWVYSWCADPDVVFCERILVDRVAKLSGETKWVCKKSVYVSLTVLIGKITAG